MPEKIEQFDIPQEYINLVLSGKDGVTAAINYADDPQPGYQVLITDASMNIVYNCARPCPVKNSAV